MATHKESKVGAASEREVWRNDHTWRQLFDRRDQISVVFVDAAPQAHRQHCDKRLLCAPLSQENFITPAVFGEIIYENFLFDIPKILDLCVLFGKGNSQLLHKMIGDLFIIAPVF